MRKKRKTKKGGLKKQKDILKKMQIQQNQKKTKPNTNTLPHKTRRKKKKKKVYILVKLYNNKTISILYWIQN